MKERGAPGPNRDPGDYLQSWKEIAAYLGREERTVRRWEKAEGLPVRRLHHRSRDSVYALKSELDEWRAGRSAEPARHRVARPGIFRPRLVWAAFLSVAAIVPSVLLVNGVLESAKTETAAVPLTGNGQELEPSLSRDAKRIAFVWDGGGEKNFDIYVRDLAGGRLTRLTDDAAPDYGPAWSSDGASLAFLRQTEPSKSRVIVTDVVSRVERVVTELETSKWPDWSRPGPHLAWSPDRKWLVGVGRHASEPIDRLLRIPVDGGWPEPVTAPPRSTQGDATPAVSPDGGFLAFSRRISWANSVLCLVPISGDLKTAGPETQIDSGAAWNMSPAWVPDRQELVFSSGRMDATHLARIRLSKSARAVRLASAGAYGWQPSVARSGTGRIDMVYTEHFESVNLWRRRLARDGPAVPLVTSPHWSYEPDYSPDGTKIAFISDRTGYAEIWVADGDGRNTQQWTFLRNPSVGSPKWSPDGQRIALSVPGADGSSIVIVDAPGKAPEPVRGSEKCGYLAWSHDGRSLYFSSNRSGSTQIWKVGVRGGEAIQVTKSGGRVPAISPDGNMLYYLRMTADGASRLFGRSVNVERETEILRFVDAYSPTPDGVAFKFYHPGAVDQGPFLALFRFATRAWTPLVNGPQPLRYGIASSPDGTYVVYSQADHTVSEIKVVQDFR